MATNKGYTKEEAFERDTKNVFYLILMFAFHIDGDVSETEKDRLSNFLRLSTKFNEDEDSFQSILSIRPPSAREVVEYLNGIKDPATRFYYLLQVFALVAGEKIKPTEAKVLMNIVEKVELGEGAKEILESIFFERDYDNKNILYVGADSKICDIVKVQTDMDALVINVNDTYYFLALNNNGLININNKVVFDYIVFKFEINDVLFLGQERLSYSDLLFRFELKSNDVHAYFSIIKKIENEVIKYLLVPEDVPDALGRLFIKGCHIVVFNDPNT